MHGRRVIPLPSLAMRGRRALAVSMVLAVVLVGCSKGSDDAKDDKTEPTTSASIPNKPAGLDGDEFCAVVPEPFIVGAVGEPYRTYDPVPLKDFPVPGVSGYECQWEWRSPQGDIRNLKVDALSFSGAMEGALDASWKGTVDTLSAKGTPREDLGEEAISAKLQGLVTLSAREGDWQITSVASSQGEASPASVEALARVTAVLLKAANEGN